MKPSRINRQEIGQCSVYLGMDITLPPHGRCPVRATGGSLPCGRYLLTPLNGNKERSKCLMVLRVKPTPTRFPTNSLYTPMDNTPLHSKSSGATRVVVGVFGQILDSEFENYTSAFEETFMGAMRTHNLWMTPKEHVLVHHVPEYNIVIFLHILSCFAVSRSPTTSVYMGILSSFQ